MPDDNRSLLARTLARFKGKDAIESTMASRKKRLDRSGGRKVGGMFDMIYKGRKAREDALSGYDQ